MDKEHKITWTVAVRGIEVKNRPGFVDGWYVEEVEELDGIPGSKRTFLYGPMEQDRVENVKADVLQVAEMRIDGVQRYINNMTLFQRREVV